jgi:hypothetical protein
MKLKSLCRSFRLMPLGVESHDKLSSRVTWNCNTMCSILNRITFLADCNIAGVYLLERSTRKSFRIKDSCNRLTFASRSSVGLLFLVVSFFRCM